AKEMLLLVDVLRNPCARVLAGLLLGPSGVVGIAAETGAVRDRGLLQVAEALGAILTRVALEVGDVVAVDRVRDLLAFLGNDVLVRLVDPLCGGACHGGQPFLAALAAALSAARLSCSWNSAV